MRVRRDGPSLWIREPGKAGRRVPARLVSRVVITGNIALEADAITLFAEQGIPVAFLRPTGDVRAVALAYDCKPGSIRERQRVLKEDDELRTRALRWFESRLRSFRLEVLRAVSPSLASDAECRGLQEREYFGVLRTLVPDMGGAVAAARAALRGFFNELIVEKTLRAGLDPHLGLVRTRENFGLCKDFAEILDPFCDMWTVRFMDTRRSEDLVLFNGPTARLTPKGHRKAAGEFEGQREAAEAKIELVLDDYFEVLREIQI